MTGSHDNQRTPEEEKNEPRKKGDYDVGYGKPPKKHQFRPGHEPYRGGRKPKIASFDDALHAALRRKVTVRRGGDVTKIPIAEAVVERLVADAMAGKGRALEQLIMEMRRLSSENAVDNKQQLAEDEQIVSQFLALMRKANEG